jgi:hypothetical protein
MVSLLGVNHQFPPDLIFNPGVVRECQPKGTPERWKDMASMVVHPAHRLRGLGLHIAPQPYCQVCFAPQTRPYVARDRSQGLRMTVRVCERCGYVEMPDTARREKVRAVVTDRMRSRGRAADRRDRELGMAMLAVDVLARPDLSVLLLGYGRSVSNRRVGQLAAVARVIGQDITAIGDDREFVGDGPAGGERFDVVVAADIVERFTDPHAGFAKIFGLVDADGVLICSMRVYDSRDLEHQRHRFGRTHASHYTPKSLRRIAAAHNWSVDFRLPAREPHAGKRQRYVIFARSQTVMEAVSDYFGRHRFAPPDDSAPAMM